jgi:cytochrome c553
LRRAMRSRSCCLLLLLASLIATPLRAAEPPAALKEIVEACAVCHGPKGVSAIEGVPSIAGQPDIFTQYQLVFIRDGARKVEVMQEAAKTLTDENIRDLGAYYAALPPPPAQKPARPVDRRKAEALIGPRRCDSCHLPNYAGQGESARLAGQRPEYIVKAMHDYRSGERRGRGMGIMMQVSVTLQDQEIELIAAYLAAKP